MKTNLYTSAEQDEHAVGARTIYTFDNLSNLKEWVKTQAKVEWHIGVKVNYVSAPQMRVTKAALQNWLDHIDTYYQTDMRNTVLSVHISEWPYGKRHDFMGFIFVERPIN
jgi:antibiotic biosynthesis monooxygenase (ABM) superfamily enzyme